MLCLYLCRHAKSSWADPGQADHDRPLNERGLRDAPFMAELFRQRNEPVDLLLSSTALRAITTAQAYARALGASELDRFRPEAPRPQLVRTPELYHPTPTTILRVVNGLPGEVRRVMLFGHNPGFTEAVEYFSSDDIGNMPTCGIVRIDLPVPDWAHVGRDLGTLVWFDHPKRHRA
jgi:phosphohistidine phosphatase